MSRSHEHEIRTDASPADVWRALTEPAEITKWFCEDAEVDPSAGGRYFIKWGEGVTATHRIDVWEPERHLRLVAQADPQMPVPEGDRMVEDYTIEIRDGSTVLRLIHSGIPDGADWDGFYDGTNAGWEVALTQMRYIVERHLGKPMFGERVNGPSELAPGDGFSAVLDLLNASFDGERFTAETALGDRWTGSVVYRSEPSEPNDTAALILSIDELDGAVFTIGTEKMGAGTYVGAGVAVFGGDERAANELGQRYGKALREALRMGA